MELQMTAPCLLGLEGLVAEELRQMDAREVTAENGRVFFNGDQAMLARANINSRFAERILIVLDRFTAVTHCHAAGVPIICAMGAGNKLDPTGFQVADLAKTKMDPLARVMRRELKKRGIHHLKVVYSEEPPIPTAGAGQEDPDHPGRRSTPGSVAFVPSVMGLILAGEVIKDLIKAEK